MSNEVDLGNEPVKHLLFILAVPAIVSQLVNALYNMVDRMYIGHIADIGATALTGVGVCFPIIMIVSAFAYLVGMGGAPRASIFMGRGDRKTAEKILGNCFSALLAVAAVLTAIVLIFQRPLLYMFGASDNTIGYAMDYMTIYAVGTVFVQLTLGLNAFISAQGFSKISMMTVVIGAISNIVLDPIFIFAFDMGVRGAALATVISQAISAVWALRCRIWPWPMPPGRPSSAGRAASSPMCRAAAWACWPAVPICGVVPGRPLPSTPTCSGPSSRLWPHVWSPAPSWPTSPVPCIRWRTSRPWTGCWRKTAVWSASCSGRRPTITPGWKACSPRACGGVGRGEDA